MKYSIFILLMLGMAHNAHGLHYINYSWEDGGTVLDLHPDPDLPSIIVTNVPGKEGHPVHQSLVAPGGWGGTPPDYFDWGPPPWELSNFSLRLEQNDPGGSSAAYLVYFQCNPHTTPAISATLWYNVHSPSEPLAVSLWGRHCNDLPDNPHQNDGDAGGIQVDNFEPGWQSLSWTWDHVENIVIEFRIDGEIGDIVYLDELLLHFEWGAGEPDYDLWVPSGRVHSDSKNLNEVPQPSVELQAYPNPFNPQTTVSFSLDQTTWAKIEIFDLNGRHVATLADRTFSEGFHTFTWTGRDVRGRAMPSGTYIVRLDTESGTEAKKISLIR